LHATPAIAPSLEPLLLYDMWVLSDSGSFPPTSSLPPVASSLSRNIPHRHSLHTERLAPAGRRGGAGRGSRGRLVQRHSGAGRGSRGRCCDGRSSDRRQAELAAATGGEDNMQHAAGLGPTHRDATRHGCSIRRPRCSIRHHGGSIRQRAGSICSELMTTLFSPSPSHEFLPQFVVSRFNLTAQRRRGVSAGGWLACSGASSIRRRIGSSCTRMARGSSYCVADPSPGSSGAARSCGQRRRRASGRRRGMSGGQGRGGSGSDSVRTRRHQWQPPSRGSPAHPHEKGAEVGIWVPP
jgi:hypothetical protein